jgi:adenosylhomocysteinase
MTKLICDNSKPAYDALFNALIKLVETRLQDGSFQDQEEVVGKAYFSTLEGLEALLIPLVTLPKNTVWGPLQKQFSNLQSLIKEDIEYILTFNSKEQPPKEQGNPYFIQGKGIKQSAYWASECASFTLSVLTNFLELQHKYGLSLDISNERILKAIKFNLDWIKLCKRDTGWAWTNDSPAHPWPTWSLLDTFEEIKNCDSLEEFHEQIEYEIDPILKKIHKSFNTNVTGSYLAAWNENVVNTNPYDVQSALDLTRLMLAASLHSDKSVVKPLAYKLYAWASETDFSHVDYSYHLSARSDYITDTSLIPCVLRTLIVMAGILKPKMISKLNEELARNHEVVLHRVYNCLMKSQIGHGKYAGLWGVSKEGEGLKYELYYSERTIEALTEFLLHFVPEDMPKEDVANKNEIGESLEVEKSRTGNELKKGDKAIEDLVPAYLPILDAVALEVKRESGAQVFEDTSIIFVLHFLSDLPPFIDKYHDLGCAYSDMYFLVKTYNYPQRDTLHKVLKNNGCQVIVPPDGKDSTFLKCAKDILAKAIEKYRKSNKKILIIEDGGYFAPLFHKDEFVSNAAACIGAVEQTTKGHRRDSDIKVFQFPIISVATSRIKNALESEEVAATLQENIVGVLRKYWKDKPIREHKALIIGFGTIGSRLAKELLSKNMTVAVYDSNLGQRIKADMNRYQVLDDLKDLHSFTVIVGTSGETSLSGSSVFWSLSHNVILISGSSETIEFDLDALKSCSKKVETADIFTKYTLKKDDKIIRVVLDGQPINFALSEGISDAVIDPVYTEMFISAVRLATATDLQKGIVELTTEEESKIYELYRDYHKR